MEMEEQYLVRFIQICSLKDVPVREGCMLIKLWQEPNLNMQYVLYMHAFIKIEYIYWKWVRSMLDYVWKAEWLYSRSLALTSHTSHLGFGWGHWDVWVQQGYGWKKKKQNMHTHTHIHTYKKQAEVRMRFWICVIPIKSQMNDPASSLQWCANQRCIDNEQTGSCLEEVTTGEWQKRKERGAKSSFSLWDYGYGL